MAVLISIPGPKGEDGAEVEIRKTGEALEWRLVGSPAWQHLMDIEELRGPAGADGVDGVDGAPGADGSSSWPTLTEVPDPISALADLPPTWDAEQLIYSPAPNLWALTTMSAYIRTSILVAADAGALRTALGLVIGTHVQAARAELAKVSITASVASAATLPLAPLTGDYVTITGGVDISNFGTGGSQGVRRVLYFQSGGYYLYHNSNIRLPRSSTLQVGTGDMAEFVYIGTSWRCKWYSRADGSPLYSVIPTDPQTCYVRNDGDDVNGLGTPTKPYLTWQRGINAGFVSFDFGVGYFGAGNFGGSNVNVFVRGKGHNNTIIGQLRSEANEALGHYAAATIQLQMEAIRSWGIVSRPEARINVGDTGWQGGEVTVHFDANSLIDGDIFANGGAGGPGYDDGGSQAPSGNGGQGGVVRLIGPGHCNTIVHMGGDPGNPPGMAPPGSVGTDGIVHLSRGASVGAMYPDNVNGGEVRLALVNNAAYVSSYP